MAVRVLPFATPADVTAALPQALAHLRAGGLVAHPTETVYGLGSRATPDALRALGDLKGREPGKPFLILVSDRVMAERAGLTFTETADRLARAFWPGPLTLVLPGAPGLPDGLRGPSGGIAVRWTSHAATAQLVRALGEPLTSTSANRAGQEPARTAGEIVSEFATAAAGSLLVLDGGSGGNSPPSTVVDCTGPLARLVRAGALAGDVRALVHLAP